MEVALDPTIPAYSGGLGVLAGDTLRTAADLRLPMIGVTLLSRLGYFRQRLGPDGHQGEAPAPWPVDDLLQATPGRCRITLEGRPVAIRAWRYDVEGAAGGRVPVLFLDTDVAAATRSST